MVEVDPWDAGYSVGYEHGFADGREDASNDEYERGYDDGARAQRLASEVVEDWPGKARGSN